MIGADGLDSQYKILPSEILCYKVGALMYTPALNGNIAENLRSGKFGSLDSLVLCLEDSIMDDCLDTAEQKAFDSLSKIYSYLDEGTLSINDLPMIFIRVRSPEQITAILNKLGLISEGLTGFVLPKFDVSNGYDYYKKVTQINSVRKTPFYVMPILETPSVINIKTRVSTLSSLKSIIDDMKKYVLNVRVGGNDFCNIYGVRRGINQSIYEIGVINNALMDILNFFAPDYVVSAPVWEYFSNSHNKQWSEGLKKELELDRLNGFIGKTAIHPTQIPIIQNSLMVSKTDYDDAQQILNWNKTDFGVIKSVNGTRMSEVKVHTNWARKILILAHIYGVNENTENGGFWY